MIHNLHRIPAVVGHTFVGVDIADHGQGEDTLAGYKYDAHGRQDDVNHDYMMKLEVDHNNVGRSRNIAVDAAGDVHSRIAEKTGREDGMEDKRIVVDSIDLAPEHSNCYHY